MDEKWYVLYPFFCNLDMAWLTYIFYSDRGIVYSARAYKIPECTRNAAGTPLVQVVSILLFFYPIKFFFDK